MNNKTLKITFMSASLALIGSMAIVTSAIAKDSDFTLLVSEEEQRIGNEINQPVELKQKLSMEDTELSGSAIMQVSGCGYNFGGHQRC